MLVRVSKRAVNVLTALREKGETVAQTLDRLMANIRETRTEEVFEFEENQTTRVAGKTYLRSHRHRRHVPHGFWNKQGLVVLQALEKGILTRHQARMQVTKLTGIPVTSIAISDAHKKYPLPQQTRPNPWGWATRLECTLCARP